MCWFVTLGLSQVGAEALEEVARAQRELHFRKSSNPDVTRIFGYADVTFEVTSGGCSCDLYAVVPELDSNELDRARTRYHRKGWSEAKIARALDASANAKSAAVGRNREIGPEAAFRDVVRGLVCQFGGVRVFAHMYSGSQDEERIDSTGQQKISLNAFLESGFPPDQLVAIVEAV